MSDVVADPLGDIENHVKASLPDAIAQSFTFLGELTFVIEPARNVEVLTFLRDDPRCAFNCFIDLCGVDYPERPERFDVVVHLLSTKHNARVRVKMMTDEGTPVASIIPVFPAANWYEREAYDLFGILFSGHPDLRRLLTDYGFEGHPLRKDFPMTGFVEVRWNDVEKRIVNEPVRLTQEYRNWDFLSPWEGTDVAALPGDEKAKLQ